MNAWNPNANPMTIEGNVYSADFWIEDGTYQYKLLLNGVEESDPNNAVEVSNGIGGTNNVWKVGDRPAERLHIKVDSFTNKSLKLFPVGMDYFVLWENYALQVQDGWIYIPDAAVNFDRSYIRIWAMNTGQLSNEILIPLDRGRILTQVDQLNRLDWHSATIYNAFIDRFNNADTENDWKNPEADIHPRANYHGGDVAGVTQKIEDGYFDTLGINTIWISPIVQNPRGAFGLYPNPRTRFSAYHGYWPISFTAVDTRLTTEKDVHTLVDKAHQDNKNVLLDFIANHIHKEHPIYQDDTTIATNLYLPDGSLNTERWDEHRLTTWFDVFMPSLDLIQPKIYEMLSDSAVFWIEKYRFDGFRHDATKHVPNVFWRALSRKLKDKKLSTPEHKLFQLGETYGTPELISSYLGNGLLDAQFDFNMYDAMVAALIGEKSMNDLSDEMLKSLKYYGDHHLMGNITGNQDRARFISYASKDLLLSQDAKWEGWNRHVGIKDSTAYRTCALLNAMVSTIPGIPVIFYGDEIGIPGGNDPDNRKMMRFNNWNHYEQTLFETTSKLLNFRKKSMPLMYGDMRIIYVENDYLIYERSYLNQHVRIIINNANVAVSHTLPEVFDHALNSKLTSGTVEIPAHSFEIFYN